jgi:hypothetical protein
MIMKTILCDKNFLSNSFETNYKTQWYVRTWQPQNDVGPLIFKIYHHINVLHQDKKQTAFVPNTEA